MTTLNTSKSDEWEEIPFEVLDEKTQICRIVPRQSGLHSFRAEFSLDGGATWIPDTVPDAWILIDPPQVDALRLYTIIPTVSGNLEDWEADLHQIKKMGFNAVYLLPVTPLDRSQSPYSAKNLFEIEPSYLVPGARLDGLSQFEAFVEAAKALEIRLCFDLVLNHIGVTSDMAQRAPDWIVPDDSQPDGFQRARYWANHGWQTWDDLVLINFEHPSEAIRSEIWAYMIDYALFWAKYANETGGFVRFDNLHGSDTEFVQALKLALHSEYPEVGVLAQYFTDERTLLENVPHWELNLVLATPWNSKFVPQLREYLTYIHRVSEQVRYFMPITSHDSGSPAQEFGTADSTVPRYVAAALLGTGATGITQGVEYGEQERIDFIGKKPRWNFPEKPRFGPFIKRVNEILIEYSAFRCGNNCRFVDDGHPAVIASFRSDPDGQFHGFLVVCNFDIANPQHFSLDIAELLGTQGPFLCSELLSGETQAFPQARLELLLQPCAAQVLKFSPIGPDHEPDKFSPRSPSPSSQS